MSSTPTRFDPIIQAVSRKAETIYSKMGIRRDESEDLTKKKKGNSDSEAHAIPWEDTTEVSIAALMGFLQDLLGVAHSGASLPSPTTTPTIPAETSTETVLAPQHPHPINPAAAKAAHAYQATGMAVHDRNVETQQAAPPAESSTTDVHLGEDFGEEEKEKIKGYIRDMTDLERRGVTTLTLRRTLTFLESIHLAIEDLK